VRVIAGKFRSRPLLAPPGLATRPTADRLRETLFNVLTNGTVNRVAGASFLDLYAGSGAVGIEALSRGAASVTFVEEATAPLGILKQNLANLSVSGTSLHIEKKSVSRFLRGAIEKGGTGPFMVVFLDPPYDLAAEYDLTMGLLGENAEGLLESGALIVAEHRRKQPLVERYGRLLRTRVLKQGDAALSFYAVDEVD
jgi:16S rRNA (guanine966-N2)-methyltransferase